jgi:pimeloyl-ACP methyl ester carboxylesterase
VCLHGLGGSHVDWIAAAPSLTRRWRVLALDLPGFGRTPMAGRRTSIEANRRLLDSFLAEVVSGPAIVLGTAMGGTIAMLEAASEPARVAGLILVAPAVPAPAGIRIDREVASAFAVSAAPGVGPRMLRRRRQRLGPEGTLRESLRMTCVDPGRIPQWALDAMLDFAVERSHMPWADTAYVEAARSLVHWHTKARRRLMDAADRVEAPTLLVQGAADRLVLLAAAQKLARRRSDWTFAVLDGVGHLPMLEDTRRFLALVEEWAAGAGRTAVAAARSVCHGGHEVA